MFIPALQSFISGFSAMTRVLSDTQTISFFIFQSTELIQLSAISRRNNVTPREYSNPQKHLTTFLGKVALYPLPLLLRLNLKKIN